MSWSARFLTSSVRFAWWRWWAVVFIQRVSVECLPLGLWCRVSRSSGDNKRRSHAGVTASEWGGSRCFLHATEAKITTNICAWKSGGIHAEDRQMSRELLCYGVHRGWINVWMISDWCGRFGMNVCVCVCVCVCDGCGMFGHGCGFSLQVPGSLQLISTNISSRIRILVIARSYRPYIISLYLVLVPVLWVSSPCLCLLQGPTCLIPAWKSSARRDQ